MGAQICRWTSHDPREGLQMVRIKKEFKKFELSIIDLLIKTKLSAP